MNSFIKSYEASRRKKWHFGHLLHKQLVYAYIMMIIKMLRWNILNKYY